MQRRGGTYDDMINRLQNATSKVTTPTLYANHVRARIETMIFFKEQFMEKKNRRRWAFDSYKQGTRMYMHFVRALRVQGAIHKLVHTRTKGNCKRMYMYWMV